MIDPLLCPTCNGEGRVKGRRCTDCGATGKVACALCGDEATRRDDDGVPHCPTCVATIERGVCGQYEHEQIQAALSRPVGKYEAESRIDYYARQSFGRRPRTAAEWAVLANTIKGHPKGGQ